MNEYTAYKLHRIVQHDILFGQLEQHRVIKEFIDGYIFTQAFTTTGFHHKLTSQMIGWLGFEWFDYNTLVQWISGHDLQMKN